jgi:hypothetical protein
MYVDFVFLITKIKKGGTLIQDRLQESGPDQ